MEISMKEIIEQTYDNPEMLTGKPVIRAIEETISLLDEGRIRVAEEVNGMWVTHEWIKKAILLYFLCRKAEPVIAGPFEFYDKIPVKRNWAQSGVRAVPLAVARYGSFIAGGVVLMPSYINIGAYIDTGTMVDTWTTVGSCAQIGKNVHLSGGAGIGGVLEPLQAAPVIIEDDCFLGSRSIVVEGVRVGKEAVLGANVVITGSTRIIDVSGEKPVEYKGVIPERSVVISGTFPKKFPAGEFHVSCALIIGKRTASTDLKTSLNQALRDFNVAV